MSAAAPQIISASGAVPGAVVGAPVTYATSPGTYAAAPGMVTYAAPTTTYSAAAPTVTYGAAMPQVMYAAAPQAVPQAVPMEPTAAPQVTYAAAPQSVAAPATMTYGAPGYGYSLQHAGLQPAASMVAYPGSPVMASYYPTSVQQAWDNHFEAFGKQDLDKIMLDYDETSVVRLYNSTSGEKSEFRGTAMIRQMFATLFGELKDLGTLDAPVIDVEEDAKQVFLIWKCPGCGFKSATDTFIFGPDFKIKRQNVVVVKEAPMASATAAPVAPPTSTKVSSEKAEKKVSSKKKSTKKKSKGIC